MTPPPTEGGYGWIVLISCTLLANFVTDGYATFGVFMLEGGQRFDLPKYKLVWVGAFRISMSGLSGVFIGNITQRLGCRVITIFGTICLTVGHVSTALLSDLGLPWILLMYGFVSGIGFGCYIVAYSSAFQEYFHKRRGLANALVTLGLSIGIFIWPPLLEYLFSNYGWTGGLLLNGAIHLNGFVLAMLLPSKQIYPPMKYRTNIEISDTYQEKVSSHGETYQQKVSSHGDIYSTSLPQINPLRQDKSDLNVLSYTSLNSNNLNNVETLYQSSTLAAGASLMSLALDDNFKMSSVALDLKTTEWSNYNKLVTEQSLQETDHCSSGKYINEDFTERKPNTHTMQSNIKRSPICLQVTQIIDISLLKNKQFLMYCIGMALVHFGHVAPYVLLPSRAVENGIEKGPASFLISLIGICGGVTRLLWGCSADFACMANYKPILSGVSGILDGITSVLSFLADDYISFVVFACLWGVNSSGYSSLENAQVVYLLDVNYISKGSGTLHTILGISWFTIYVLIGILVGAFGSITTPFFVLGAVEIAGGALILSIPFVHSDCSRT